MTFRYRDTRQQRERTLTLTVDEFIRRFMMHVLPGGFMRIRHYGYLANRCRCKALRSIRALLAVAEENSAVNGEENRDTVFPCPACRQGLLQVIDRILPQAFYTLQPG